MSRDQRPRGQRLRADFEGNALANLRPKAYSAAGPRTEEPDGEDKARVRRAPDDRISSGPQTGAGWPFT
jgi:hypothetical protein